jgi:hypothetical protein
VLPLVVDSTEMAIRPARGRQFAEGGARFVTQSSDPAAADRW